MEKSYRTKIRKRRKELFVNRFGGKCLLCEYDKCINSLCFHHIDPISKEYEPTTVIYNFSIERALKELKKCILICNNCHGEIHAETYEFDINISKLIIEWFENKCNFCKNIFSTIVKKQKYCSQKCTKLAQRKVKNRPEKSELEILIEEHTWTDLGKLFNVSDNTIRNWAKNYNLI